MMLENSIYIVFLCDIWRTRSSMELIGGTMDGHKLADMVEELYNNKEISFADDNVKKIPKLKCPEDIAKEVNDTFNYIFVDVIKNGEINL